MNLKVKTNSQVQFDTINLLLHDIRAIGHIIYTLIAGDSPWQTRIGTRLIEGASIGYISFTNPLWKKVSPEALSFVKRLTKPMQASETFEYILKDPFISCNRGNRAVKKVDLPIDNIYKIKKVLLYTLLENLVVTIKRKRF